MVTTGVTFTGGGSSSESLGGTLRPVGLGTTGFTTGICCGGVTTVELILDMRLGKRYWVGLFGRCSIDVLGGTCRGGIGAVVLVLDIHCGKGCWVGIFGRCTIDVLSGTHPIDTWWMVAHFLHLCCGSGQSFAWET